MKLIVGPFAGLLMLLVPHGDLLAQTASEYELKAAFLYQFAGYIEWPPSAETSSTFTIGILGEDRFGDAFDAIEGKTVGGRPVRVRKFRRRADLEPVDILYVSDSERQRLKELIASLATRPTLTVSDDASFMEVGGIIRMVVRDRIDFHVNRCAAERAGLHISARLLKFAAEVIDQCGGGEP